ncbi:hypothetical protein CspeluHIS016_0405210 [Cutaneotrichosporon spelunceum]|uniref:HTH APSES-type domain-containing protein n=1 Tax=Cutaneotrichosporon spelunceum TaxID=1672016 RepID=A0AAD3TWG2_9TREE|nr:hypothetical protein CspeluHIS016_0405210 [Cutaneotrichosporon spelunceum]
MEAKPNAQAQPGQQHGQGQSGHPNPPMSNSGPAGASPAPGLLPALSPDMSNHPYPQMQQIRPPMPPGAMHGGHPPSQQQQPRGRQGSRSSQHNVFQAVMGPRPGEVPQGEIGGPGNVKVYASAYSQIPVYEAMIRNISVMRRMADSWVNATQILKVAGISKSVRTKMLEKQVQTQQHEKVQGGYGKYQGTWIPLDRGRALAEQVGVLHYLAPIFDFVPSPSGPPALPMRGNTPNKAAAAAAGHPGMMPPGSAGSGGRMMSPFQHTGNVPLPPQFAQQHMGPGGPEMMGPGGPQMLYPPPQGQHMQQGPMFFHPGQQQQPPPHPGMPPLHQQHPGHPGPPHPHHPMHQMSYEQGLPPPQQQQMRLDGPIEMQQRQPPPQQQQQPQGPLPLQLQPPAMINGHGGPGPMQGLPPPPSTDVYVDQFGQPQSISGAPRPAVVGEQGEDGEPPVKRQRIGDATQSASKEETTSNDDDDADDELRDKPPLPPNLRLSTKPFKPRLSAESHRRRQQLLSLFSSGKVDVRQVFEMASDATLDWDIDMVIDEQGHTALHWACALGHMNIIKQLIELGADIHRGNYAGETPLIRSVLTTNHADAGTFGELLSDHLGASVRTLDHAYCSVIHHIAFSSGLKGRQAPARGYMAEVLGYVAREQSKEKEKRQNVGSPTEGISLKLLVDLQDLRGDTALNVAARMGSKPLVNLLLDAGADKTKANKLGLRPVDFGVEVDALTVAAKEAAVAQLKSEVKRPEKRSQDVLKNIAGIFEAMNNTFGNEMEQHVVALSEVEKNVRVATRSLAEKRQLVDAAREKLATLEQQAERAANAKRALDAPDADWTGRTVLKGETAPPPAFGMGLPLLPGLGPKTDREEKIEELQLPNKGQDGALVALRRIAEWEERAAKLLEERATELEGDGADRAIKYRKVIAMCAKVSVDQVDDMLDGLTTAVESEDQTIDLSRISGLVTRLRRAPVA